MEGPTCAASGPAGGAHPGAEYDESHPLQARVTNLDADPYVGRLAALPRAPRHDPARPAGGLVPARRHGREREGRELYVTEGLERVPAVEAGPGEIIGVAGLPEVTIGETIADPADPRPLPLIAWTSPLSAMTIGINTSPLAGRSGSRLTARMVKDRLGRSWWATSRSGCSTPTGTDTWEVQGRGELQLAVLVETMRSRGLRADGGQARRW